MPSRRRRCLAPFAVLAIFAGRGELPAQEPAADAAPGKVLEIQARILDIQGRALDIVGVSLGIETTLKELGAKVTAQEIRIELAADVLSTSTAELRADAAQGGDGDRLDAGSGRSRATRTARASTPTTRRSRSAGRHR
jgi:hypothetical protein